MSRVDAIEGSAASPAHGPLRNRPPRLIPAPAPAPPPPRLPLPRQTRIPAWASYAVQAPKGAPTHPAYDGVFWDPPGAPPPPSPRLTLLPPRRMHHCARRAAEPADCVGAKPEGTVTDAARARSGAVGGPRSPPGGARAAGGVSVLLPARSAVLRQPVLTAAARRQSSTSSRTSCR